MRSGQFTLYTVNANVCPALYSQWPCCASLDTCRLAPHMCLCH